ncbi:malonate decarboxylase holo-ACP synthase [Inquilinus sp. CA228]|uniref:malonate decarboxylase holo-ACP synthase n=1 Tax=Inquilinus sp. CA228 TaxID=3455609 RepID=UPI003F8D41E5
MSGGLPVVSAFGPIDLSYPPPPLAGGGKGEGFGAAGIDGERRHDLADFLSDPEPVLAVDTPSPYPLPRGEGEDEKPQRERQRERFVTVPHDLLRIDVTAIAEFTKDLPGWAASSLAAAPWVVVRRALPFGGLLPIGIRGSGRSERCAAWLPPGAVVECRTPEDLAAARAWEKHPRRAEIPALTGLDAVAALFSRSDWGPAGSVGFELATGRSTANPDSDLDIVLRAPGRIGPDAAGRLLAALAALPVRIDVAVETPLGACSLAEIAAGGTVVVKTPTGPRLVRDPWAEPVA